MIRPLFRSLVTSALVGLSVLAGGCSDYGQSSDNVTDVNHTDVERQSIGNCWLYAQASWVESLHLSETGEKFDISQSYWTYWHWFDEITQGAPDELETGGSMFTANEIIMDRGLMQEAKFIKEDSVSEMSSRQKSALDKVQVELKTGRLKNRQDRYNKTLVRSVLDDAWQLSSTVKGQMTKAFGKGYTKTLQNGGTTAGTSVIAASKFGVFYTERDTDPNVATEKHTTLDVAIDEWTPAYYPAGDSQRRSFQIRVQRALHDRQPVVITWDVDFNAMESSDPVLRGSFNLTTLAKSGRPGRQGGHMTVLEDYEIETAEFGLLKAGVTLDPSLAEDAAKLEAALLPTSTLKFLRIKNSWGAFRDDRASAVGFPGYHDLHADYLNGPIAWCPDAADPKSATSCTGKTNPWDSVAMPPGY